MENIEAATTRELLRNKIVKILSLLLLIRLGLYIPIPKVDLDILSQSGNVNSIFGFAKNLTGSSFLGIGSLGILPYINSSIVIQLLTPVVPALERLQKEEGELGRQQIAGSSIRTVLELAGVQNILSKQLGSNNLLNNARATVNGLSTLKSYNV